MCSSDLVVLKHLFKIDLIVGKGMNHSTDTMWKITKQHPEISEGIAVVAGSNMKRQWQSIVKRQLD